VDILVREAAAADGRGLAALLEQLGYRSSVEAVCGRLERFTRETHSRVLVAEVDGRLVGAASLSVIPLLERDGRKCRLSAIVVDEGARGAGVGRALVEAVEAEARERDCIHVELTTSERRTGAHAFYRALGYEEVSKRFLKALV
jgi:GNAT superfamily N-acetyltransferase